jgi:uncharacterized protein YdaU (DUF1376 family)
MCDGNGKPKPLFQPWNDEQFVADFRVRGMTAIQRWMYRALLQAAFFHETRPYLPNDDDVLWVLAGCESIQQWMENKPAILKCFSHIEGGLLSNKRLTADWAKFEAEREAYVERGKRSGSARRRRIDEETNPGSTAVQPQLNLGSTAVQPQLNPGSTAVQPQLNLGSTAVQPQLNLGSTAVQPQLNPGSTAVQPQLNLGSTAVQPQLNPGSTAVEPELNPGSTAVQPQLNKIREEKIREEKIREEKKRKEETFLSQPSCDEVEFEAKTPVELKAAVKHVWEYYLKKCERDPKVNELTFIRKKKGVLRLKECLVKTKGDLSKAIEAMKWAIDNIAASDFHMGRDSASKGKKFNNWEKHIFDSYEQMEKWWNKG